MAESLIAVSIRLASSSNSCMFTTACWLCTDCCSAAAAPDSITLQAVLVSLWMLCSSLPNAGCWQLKRKSVAAGRLDPAHGFYFDDHGPSVFWRRFAGRDLCTMVFCLVETHR